MATIVLQILSSGTPVDEMEKDSSGRACPLATRDDELNMRNKQKAVDEAAYRDAESPASFRADEVCGNCGAYNQTEEMLECIGEDDDDPRLGYCQIFKFVCEAAYTCDKWVSGGPITNEKFADRGETF